MIFETKLTEKERLVEINQYGKSIHILKAAPVTRISVLKAGHKIIDTVVWQGMALGGIEFDQIVITSDTPQEIAIWAARTPFDFKQVSTRQQTLQGEHKFIGKGIHTLLENDPSRIIARIEPDRDIWIGGDDLEVDEYGYVKNGRKYKADNEFELTAYGQVKCFITNDAEYNLFTNDLGVKSVYVPHGTVPSAAKFRSLNAPYFDIEVPERMDGVPFDLNTEVTLDGVATISPRLYYTKGTPDSDSLTRLTTSSGGPYEGVVKGKTYPEIVLSAGAHRFYIVTAAAHEGYAEGDETKETMTRVFTTNDVYALAGSVQIMQERA